MRIAALSDIHSNLPALEAVMADVRAAGVDRIVVGGDVLPGSLPVETLAYLAALDIPLEFLHGNGDREVLAAATGNDLQHYATVFKRNTIMAVYDKIQQVTTKTSAVPARQRRG
jgi:predicted phosphodiesterase